MSGQIIYRSGYSYTQEEKFAIVKGYLESNLSRNAIVKKYQIGQGTLIAWLRIFGVEKNNENNKSVMVRKLNKTKSDAKSADLQNGVNQELLRRIEELEEALEYEKLRSLAYSTMIDIAEEDFKIKIRKKDGAENKRRKALFIVWQKQAGIQPVSISIRYHKVTNLLNFIINPSENYYRIKYCINFVNKF